MSSHHASSSKGGDKGGEKGDKADSPHQQKQWFEREQPSFVPISEKELEMGECLGSGAFGQVYKAKYKGKVVAVKFTSGSKKKEFEAELRALMGVNHPNIIRLYGASIAPPRFFLVMELGSNSLHTYLRETSYEMLDVYKWALQIAEVFFLFIYFYLLSKDCCCRVWAISTPKTSFIATSRPRIFFSTRASS